MSKLIAENLVDAILNNDEEGIMSSFSATMAERVNDALEVKKVEVASTLIAPAAEADQIYEEAQNPVKYHTQQAKMHSAVGHDLSDFDAANNYNKGTSEKYFDASDAHESAADAHEAAAEAHKNNDPNAGKLSKRAKQLSQTANSMSDKLDEEVKKV